ncbi:aminotransferase, putative [Talaromyces stipitatus ATCC 10500]|uniref:Aminotransferase, putative n=1 Tax=Talaromyces stipitatus (strain ATCC 10500 / CBS 375.48 / QM 6759 / NRRL 1006) TaxID=441959 RepID=B8M623_TALSN|nr:aminotransferase, putative [Talaromyces stipitatus ATCC 10500]EED19023.1 aminotransferase, putative [Talaromyces stipitatus ATCC 10500]
MVSLLDSFQTALDKREARSARRRLTVSPTATADFSSNDFLSLSRSPLLRSQFLQNLNASYSSSSPSKPPPSLGSGGSRLLDGNSRYAEELEKFIAGFHNASDGLLFNSGFDANVGVFSCLPQPGDIIIHDELIHASVHEGMRLSRARVKMQFAHNSVSDLERVIKKATNDEATRHAYNVFIAVETLYSMDGDTAPLKDIIRLVEGLFPKKNAYLIVDEAHATGVFGYNGAGVAQDLGVEDKIFIRTHTFGKSLASQGAIVLCDSLTKEYLINYARTLIYTTAMSMPSLIAIRSAYEVMAEGKTRSLQSNLQSNIAYFQSRCDELKGTIASSLVHIDYNDRSPIFSVRTKVPRELARHCQERGLLVRPIMAPTVPLGRERVRVCLHAGNTRQEMDRLLNTIKQWAVEQHQPISRL